MIKLFPTKILDSVYSDDTLNRIKNVVDSLKTDKLDIYHKWGGLKQGELLSTIWKIPLDNQLDMKKELLSPISNDLVNDIITQDFFHLVSRHPYEIHCDYGHLQFNDNEESFYVFVIPLETVNAKTVLLDQVHHGLHFPDFKNNNQPLTSDKRMSKEDFQEYCDHCWPQDRLFVSLQTVFEWQKGSVLMFDARHLHLSNNYRKDNVFEKNALVLFSKINKANMEKYYSPLAI